MDHKYFRGKKGRPKGTWEGAASEDIGKPVELIQKIIYSPGNTPKQNIKMEDIINNKFLYILKIYWTLKYNYIPEIVYSV